MTLIVLTLYLGLVLAIGAASRRAFRGTGEDFFVATRTIGPFVLLMSLFGTHMTAFSLLGASGEAYHRGVGVFSLMASSSALVAPLAFLALGTRMWALGRRHGWVTQIELVRERWGSEAVALLFFGAVVVLLVPYLLIGVMGAGITLQQITAGAVAPWVGSLAVCAVVLIYVSAGGVRGTAWANTFQTLVFMLLGALAFAVIVQRLGGLGTAMGRVAAAHPELLVHGDAVPGVRLLSYTLIPLSVGAFPHITMHWLTARSARAFRVSIVWYPVCVAAVWLPSVLLGVLGREAVPGLVGPAANGVLVRMIDLFAPEALGGLLAAGVMAAIMSSLDSQVLALSTIFSRDVVGRVGGSTGGDVRRARLFVAAILLLTFGLSQVVDRSIFKLGEWTFSGYAGLVPVIVAALFWRRSTAGGAAAATLSTVLLLALFMVLAGDDATYSVAGSGVLPVVVIVVASTAAMVVGSLLGRPPEPPRLARFFPDPGRAAVPARGEGA